MKEKFISTVKKYLPAVLTGAILIGSAWTVMYGTTIAVMCLVLTLLGWM